jgi:hypothetical protein
MKKKTFNRSDQQLKIKSEKNRNVKRKSLVNDPLMRSGATEGRVLNDSPRDWQDLGVFEFWIFCGDPGVQGRQGPLSGVTRRGVERRVLKSLKSVISEICSGNLCSVASTS